ncbi:serine/threonine-protein phosphatase 7 long form homolog [Primulina huaijiensis]|uniref:serine/threonine-protein phosphatase 7 long form homolog n=1 Tax=Primulina huaijiensis TaxID=1492673 RepID=UPI003CC6F8EF
MDALIPPRLSDKCLWRLLNVGIHLRVCLCLARMGFYGVIHCDSIKYYDNHLLTAIVEKWRRETHTFHLTVGKTTITLQEVAFIWGLNIDDMPITGVDTAYNKNTLQQCCATWLGFTPTSSQIKGALLYLTALLDHCLNNMINDQSTEEDVAQYSRCVALMIIGGCMFPDSEGAVVKLMYLQFLDDIEIVNTFRGGSAVLAYLYRELCDTSMRLKVDLSGPVQILHIWVWSRITLLCPDRAQQLSMSAEQAGDVLQGLPFPPYGARWRRGFSRTHTAHHSVRIMRDMLDRMVEGRFLWTIYDMESLEVSRILDGNRIHLCRSACTLINFHIVEMHRPERYLRQFGMRQGIPPLATNFDNFHKLTRQGRNNFDWATYHKDFVEMWNDRYNFVIGGDYVIPGTPAITVDYVGWYHHISQIVLSPPVVPSNIMGYHLVDANYRQFITRPAHVQYPPMWTGNEFEPGPSSSNMTYTTPPVVSSFPSYDAGYYTPFAGSFTQFLQSDFRPSMSENRPIFNTSPIQFEQYSDTERYEVGGNIADTSTSAAQTSTHGDDEQMLGRGRRVIRRPPCGTGGHI